MQQIETKVYPRERRAQRIAIRNKATCESSSLFSQGVAEDLSLIGVRFMSPESYSRGEKVRLLVEFGDKTSAVFLPFYGEVVWSKKMKMDRYEKPNKLYRIGVKFKKMNDEVLRNIKYHISDFSDKTDLFPLD